MRKRLALGLCIRDSPEGAICHPNGRARSSLGAARGTHSLPSAAHGRSHQLPYTITHNVNAAPEVPSIIQYSYPGAGSSLETFHWEVEKPGLGANRKPSKDGPFPTCAMTLATKETTHISTQLVD